VLSPAVHMAFARGYANGVPIAGNFSCIKSTQHPEIATPLDRKVL